MSKYGKHIKDREYRRQTRETNRNHVMKFSDMHGTIDRRSNWETFYEWCKECTDGQVFVANGVLSILGSDGIDVTDSKLGKADWNNPVAIERELENEGYYESGEVLFGEEYYTAPKVRYLEWFNKKFHTNYRI